LFSLFGSLETFVSTENNPDVLISTFKSLGISNFSGTTLFFLFVDGYSFTSFFIFII